MLSYQTLHCHTIKSDGTLTHIQVLDECKKNNIGIVAFTDHDSLMTRGEFAELKKLHHSVQFISGIEISVKTIKEVVQPISLFHIVGLFVDFTNQKLITHTQKGQEKRIERAKKIISNIKQLGFDLELADVMQFARGQTIGRPHIAKAILAKSENIELIDQLAKQMKEAAKNDEETNKRFQLVNIHNNFQKIFDLFLTEQSFIKGIYVSYEDGTDMDDAVQLIRQAGGIAVLAHWSYSKDLLPFSLIEKLAQEKRIDGIETIYGFDVEQIRKEEFIHDMNLLQSLCKTYHLAQGGGGDFHKKEDFSLMTNHEKAYLANRTKGLVEQIEVLYPNFNRSFSTL